MSTGMDRTGNPSRSRRLGLAALALTASVALAGCAGDAEPSGGESATGATDEPTSAPGSTAAAGTGTPTPTTATTPASSSAPAQGEKAVPLYFVGETPLGQRLYREFQRVSDAAHLVEALELLASGEPVDPDYFSLVPPGDVVDVRVETAGKKSITVVLPAGSPWLRAGDLTREEARLAAQSVVYTVQGAAGLRAPVHVTVEGGQPATLFGLDTTGGLQAAPPLDVLALVNITTPTEGSDVPAGTLTAEGVASSFEGTVVLQVRDSRGDVVQESFTTAAGWMDRLYPWTGEVDLSALVPGTYTFAARTDDPSGGAEGPGPFEDTKTITVQ